MSRRDLVAAGLGAGVVALARGAVAQAPKRGGTFVSAKTTEATGLDPQLVPALSRSRVSPLMYNQLVRLGADLRPVPDLAESWRLGPDGLTWTFRLRQGVKFHDGRELTSADVKFTFDRLFEQSPGKSDFTVVDRVEPVGRYGVTIHTQEPFAALLAALGGFWGYIVNEAVVKAHGDLNRAEAGTGPFILHDWTVEQQMVLKRNPKYFRKDRPRVEEVNLRIIPDEANIVAALRTGQIHHAFIEDNKNYNLLKDEATLTAYRSPRLGYDFLNINASRGPLRDARVRQAINWAVDRSQVLRVAAAGLGRLTPPATAPMRQWQLRDEQWMPYYRPDPERAKRLLAAAGFAGGFTVTLTVIPTFPTMVSGAQVIAAQLRKVGIRAEIENVEYAVWIKRWLAHDFDLTMNTTPGYADPDTAFFRALHGTKGQNWNSWSVPEIDRLLEQGRRTLDAKRRKEIYDRVQLLILERVPQLWLFSSDAIDVTQRFVRGFAQHPTTFLYSFEDVWLDRA
jgi:peptide/nickel transport system substrate-binding protein